MNFANMRKQEQKNTKNISKYSLSQFGLSKDNFTFVEKIEDLKNNPPLIIVAEAQKNVAFIQNYFKPQTLKKKVKYVMGISAFKQLQHDPVKDVRILKPAAIKFTNVYKPYNGQDLTNKTLLVWRSGGIGDLLFIQPNLVYLKNKYPSCKILFACGPQYQPMVETWDCIDLLLDLPFPLKYLIESDYHALFEGVIERTREAEKSCSYNLFSRWLGLDLDDELLHPEQRPDEEEVVKCKEILKSFNIEEGKFIVAQMRASSIIRTPREEIFTKLFKYITDKGYKILITDNPRKSQEIQKYIDKTDKENLINFSKFSDSIAATIALVSLSKMVISPDSSLIHIAESLGIKSFGIYGPFPGRVRLTTYKDCEWVDCEKECGPCFIHGQNPCKNTIRNYPSCFDNIKYNEAFEKIERQLQ
jgi:ADP-heptose:LPS heptosyltransferase